MRTTSRLIAIGLLAGCVATALAQSGARRPVIGERPPEIWVSDKSLDPEKKDQSTAQSLWDRHRNRILLLFFFRSDDPVSMEAFPKVLKLAEEYRKRGVVVIGVSSEKEDKGIEEAVKAKIEEGKLSYFEWFYNSLGMFFLFEVPAPPRIYMVNTEGILVAAFHPEDDLEGRLRAQIRKTPPPGADEASLTKRLGQAEAEQAKKELGRAYTYVKEVLDLAESGSELYKRADETKTNLEKAAGDWMTEARQLARDKKYDEAFAIFAEVSVRFAKTEAGEEADKELSKHMADRDLKVRINKARDNAQGRWNNDDAAELAGQGRYLAAIKRYRETVEKYPDTAAAQAADTAIEKLHEDPSAQARIKELRAEEEADRWLEIADLYRRVKLFPKAREYYERIMQDHGNTPAAAKARERLDTLEKEEPTEQPVELSAQPS